MPNAKQPVWFITGCSTGFGRELARTVLEKGFQAAVTARQQDSVTDLVAKHPERTLSLALDVTDPKQVRDAVAAAEVRFGGIDVLVNNAGYGYLAAIEEGEDAEIRAMFEANFFGLADMVRAALPGMRRAGRGHIVNITSVGGLVGNPGSGYYAATKFAVEGLTEALAKEVAPLGIKVTAVEPGPFRTDWAGRSLKQTQNPIDAYAGTAGARRAQIAGYSGQQPGDPVRAAEAIIALVEAAEPPGHLILGKPGLSAVRQKLETLQREIADWESTTTGADYPEAEKPA
ncbi:MAG: short-chain dehydrogenase/reductase [Rhodospirillales bacterium 20-64-7]|nr:MAG: short-chain dehydrogenase/reductase [Rhodospirillales bacterium 20-64-7]